MRPLWELATTRTIAEHLRLQGSSDEAAYSAAALVTRALDRHFGLQRMLSGRTLTDRLDLDDPEKVPAQFIAAMHAFWGLAGGPGERRRLLEIAQASLLRGGGLEAKAAGLLASETRSMASVWGRLGEVWQSGTWGLGGLGGFSSGFGALRDEMAASGATVLAAYDRLVAASRERKAVVEKFQTWAKWMEWYTGRIDGIWGPLTEAAFARSVPMAEGRLSELRDTVALKPAMGLEEGLSDTALAAAGIAVLVTRDIWLVEHPEMLTKVVPAMPAEPEYVPGGASQVVVTYPKDGTVTSSTPLPGGGSQVVISYPKAEGAGTGAETEISVPVPAPEDILAEVAQVARPRRGPSADQLVAGGVILAGGTIVVLSVLARRRRRQSLSEAVKR